MEDKKKDSGQSRLESFFGGKGFYIAVSYTHLTLPTIA